jgi:hypothetical protein
VPSIQVVKMLVQPRATQALATASTANWVGVSRAEFSSLRLG